MQNRFFKKARRAFFSAAAALVTLPFLCGSAHASAFGSSLSVVAKTRLLREQPLFWAALLAAVVALVFFTTRFVMERKLLALKRREQEYKAITDQALRTIARTIDAKDRCTKGHSIRVARYSRLLAARLDLSEEEQEKVYYMALLHDIGKIGIPDSILNKPSQLTEEEFAVMRRHTVIGNEILKDFTALPEIAEGALSHHEWYNGEGYPNRKAGGEIPFVVQIICAADAYDAMATKRPYKEPRELDYILEELRTCSGTQFAPCIAETLIRLIGEGEIIPGEAEEGLSDSAE